MQGGASGLLSYGDTALINELAGLHEHLLLVLDDYHAITQPEIHASLDVLLDNLP